MRHGKSGKKLSRERDQRRALKKTLLTSLIINEKVSTTEAKAKEMKRLIDTIITKAKSGKNNPDKRLAVNRILPSHIAPVAVKKITGDFLNRFEGRMSGYTRVVKTGARKSDGARMAIIEFV